MSLCASCGPEKVGQQEKCDYTNIRNTSDNKKREWEVGGSKKWSQDVWCEIGGKEGSKIFSCFSSLLNG